MSAYSAYAAECEGNVGILLDQRVATMTAYVEFVQNDGSDGLPISGDALATITRGAHLLGGRRLLAARARMEAQQ